MTRRASWNVRSQNYYVNQYTAIGKQLVDALTAAQDMDNAVAVLSFAMDGLTAGYQHS